VLQAGRWKNGVMNVLSHTLISRCRLAISAARERSMSLSIGLVGVSTHSSLVFGVMAASMFAGFVMSTNENASPCRLKTLSNRRNVPP
jgi:cytochrome bd-type quinol oxidase subunit 2